MTRFDDGPLAGKVLMLKRSPRLLRAVVNVHTGEADALDMLRDTPGAAEMIYVYRLTKVNGTVHIRPGGWFRSVEYSLHPEQPDQATLRDTAAWRAWARANDPKRANEEGQPQ